MKRHSILSYIAMSLLFALAFGLGTALGDGKVTTAPADPITYWKIDELKFPGLADARNVAVVTVKFYRDSGKVDHTQEITVSGNGYSSLLAAINTTSGADEATLLPDLSRIFRLRISRWLVSNGKLAGVTAEPLISTSTQ